MIKEIKMILIDLQNILVSLKHKEYRSAKVEINCIKTTLKRIISAY